MEFFIPQQGHKVPQKAHITKQKLLTVWNAINNRKC